MTLTAITISQSTSMLGLRGPFQGRANHIDSIDSGQESEPRLKLSPMVQHTRRVTLLGSAETAWIPRPAAIMDALNSGPNSPKRSKSRRETTFLEQWCPDQFQTDFQWICNWNTLSYFAGAQIRRPFSFSETEAFNLRPLTRIWDSWNDCNWRARNPALNRMLLSSLSQKPFHHPKFQLRIP